MKPFNLEDALAGKAVMLRDGSKAYVRHHETELNVTNGWQLQGIKEDGDLVAWALDGSIGVEEIEYVENEIIGMYHETRIVNGFEVPLPETAPLKEGTQYFMPILHFNEHFYSNHIWRCDELDKLWLKRGIVFLNKEDAEANAKAMLGIDPYGKGKKNEII